MSIFKVSYSKYDEKKGPKNASDLDRKILDLEEQFSKERDRHQSKKKESGDISNLISLKKNKVEQLYQNIEDTTLVISELQKSKKELKKIYSDLEVKYDTLSSKKKKVDTENLEVSDEVFKIEKLIKEKKLEIDECIREIDDRSQSFSKRANLLEQMLGDLNNLEIESNEIIESLFQKKDEWKELNKKIDLARGKINSKNNEIRELNPEITKSEMALNKLELFLKEIYLNKKNVYKNEN
jgi:chromosome segregation ATPase